MVLRFMDDADKGGDSGFEELSFTNCRELINCLRSSGVRIADKCSKSAREASLKVRGVSSSSSSACCCEFCLSFHDLRNAEAASFADGEASDTPVPEAAVSDVFAAGVATPGDLFGAAEAGDAAVSLESALFRRSLIIRLMKSLRCLVELNNSSYVVSCTTIMM